MMDGGSSTTAVTGTPVACRWNPTKEQVNMLENLYGQGLRTPTAEQIQEITTTLQTYGHIEGKNVFYWFQNHKARQRQKQKQDHLSLFRHPFLHPPPSNVVYEPFYMAQNNIALYAHHQSQLLSPNTSTSTSSSSGSVIRRRSPRATKPRPPDGVGSHQPESVIGVARGRGNNNMMMNKEKNEIINTVNGENDQQTLNLFPLHPTGILKERVHPTTAIRNASCHASSGCTSSFSGGAVDKLCFDFFS